jgi:hypothetical protein
MGYKYPRRARAAYVAEPEKWTRAVIFNRAVAANNPWIQHLINTLTYDEIRAALQEARASYKPKDPKKREDILKNEIRKLQEEYQTIYKVYFLYCNNIFFLG